MIKLKKELKEIKERLLQLEIKLSALNTQAPTNDVSNSPSYKEVIDEWLNGKKH